MRFIPTRVHGVLDYLYAVLAITSPWLLGFALGGAETVVPVLLGLALLIVSLFTDYELGAIRAVPVPAHLAVDGLGGALLASLVTETVPRSREPGDPDDMHSHAGRVSEEQARPPYPEEF